MLPSLFANNDLVEATSESWPGARIGFLTPTKNLGERVSRFSISIQVRRKGGERGK